MRWIHHLSFWHNWRTDGPLGWLRKPFGRKRSPSSIAWARWRWTSWVFQWNGAGVLRTSGSKIRWDGWAVVSQIILFACSIYIILSFDLACWKISQSYLLLVIFWKGHRLLSGSPGYKILARGFNTVVRYPTRLWIQLCQKKRFWRDWKSWRNFSNKAGCNTRRQRSGCATSSIIIAHWKMFHSIVWDRKHLYNLSDKIQTQWAGWHVKGVDVTQCWQSSRDFHDMPIDTRILKFA